MHPPEPTAAPPKPQVVINFTDSAEAIAEKLVAAGAEPERAKTMAAELRRRFGVVARQAAAEACGLPPFPPPRLGTVIPARVSPASRLSRLGEPVVGCAAPCGRNGRCPCGSGRKFKRCHGAPAGASCEGD